VLDQVPKLMGVHITKQGFFTDLVSLVQHLPQTSLLTLLLALATFAVLIGMERLWPHSPAPLVAVAGGIAASWLLGLQAQGVGIVGQIPQGLPAVTLPDLGLVAALAPGALGIALMSFTESIAAGRAFARPEEPRPVPDRELLALGLANAGGGLVGAMPAGGGTSQTAVNRMAGAKSQVAELVTAAGGLATLLFLAPLIGLMPKAALAAVVIVYSLDLIQPSEFKDIRSVRTAEFRWALVAFAGVVLLGTLQGIVVAVIVSLLSLAHQAYNPPIYELGRKRGTTVFRQRTDEHPDDETWPGLLMLRIEGRLFFANAQRLGDVVWPLIEQAQPRVVLLDGRAIIDLEYTALKMLAEAEERLRRDGRELWLAGLNPSVFEVVERSKVGKALGRERMFLDLQSAVERFEGGRK
jgi:MFS superfamily sulfate permease-like transporter